jgi:hypothetical protein
MTVFEVARLRRIALLGLYYRTCLPIGSPKGASRDVAERWAAGMSRERLTAAIVTAQETAAAP